MDNTKVIRRNVFIGGASRSGTTMLGAILGSHSYAIATPESQFKFDIEPVFASSEFTSEKGIDFITRDPRFIGWDVNIDWTIIDFSSTGNMVSGLVDQYAQAKHKSEAAYWIDHTPTNLRHSDLLNTQYPDCRFIHIIRDGRAVMASQFKMDWGSNDPVFASMKWIEPLCVGFACESAFPDRCLRVHYEQLVLHPERECQRICAFLGWTFEPDMIRGEDFTLPAYTISQHQLVGRPPDIGRIDDWKNTLSSKEIQMFEQLTFDLLPMLGYEKMHPGYQPKPSEWHQAWILFSGAVKYMTLNAWRRKKRLAKETKGR